MSRWLTRVRLRLRSLFLGSRVDRELDEELQYHLEREVESGLASGLTLIEARRAARRKFGPMTQTREACQDMRRVTFVDHRIRDFRFAVRQIVAHPGFAGTAILVLALGVCATVTIFGFVDAALVKPLPYPRPSQLVTAFAVRPEGAPGQVRGNVSYLDFRDWSARARVFSAVAAYDVRSGFLLTTPEGPRRVPGLRVSANFFRTLGVTPVLGRTFDATDEGPAAAATVVLAYSTWQTRFGGRSNVVGQTVMLQGESHVVIGVLPDGFLFPMAQQTGFWATLRGDQPCWRLRGCRSLEAVARLSNDASMSSASAALTSVIEQLRHDYPDTHREVQVARLVPLRDVMLGDVRPILLMLASGAGLLMLIAFINVVSLLLARADSRAREFALRRALGASSVRLFWQFATEALLLVTLGGGAGLIAALWGMRSLSRLLTADMISRMPYFQALGLSAHVLGFAGVVCLCAWLVFTFTPVLLSTSADIDRVAASNRGSAGATWRRFGMYLVAAELAIAILLLVNAGLVSKSFYRWLHVDAGFNRQQLVIGVVIAPLAPAANQTSGASAEFARQVANRVIALPGVQAVGYADLLPLGPGLAPSSTFWVPGRPEERQLKEDWPVRRVSVSYLQTLQATLIRGRLFSDDDVKSVRPLAIINDTAARRYFPRENPLGRSLALGGPSSSGNEIIGVVADIKEGPPDAPAHPAIYLPFDQVDFSFAIRSALPDRALIPSLVPAIHEVRPDVLVTGMTTMTERLDSLPSTTLRRSSTWLLGGFAAFAFLLSVCGLYGVVAYSVGQRTREIGIRMALGAQRRGIYQLVLGQAAGVIAVGSVFGLLSAIGAATLLRRLLFDVQPWDPLTLSVAACALVMAAMGASYVPARHATSVNPAEVLRVE
jgi:macrolide transport system ATP-binding/permease protein